MILVGKILVVAFCFLCIHWNLNRPDVATRYGRLIKGGK